MPKILSKIKKMCTEKRETLPKTRGEGGVAETTWK